jgi:hypothetical protein
VLGLAVAVFIVGISAGCIDAPTPIAACRTDSDCPTGRCLAGACVEALDVAVTDGATDTQLSEVAAVEVTVTVDADAETQSGTKPACTADLDCDGVFGHLGTCAEARCNVAIGECELALAATTTACQTDDPCPKNGNCKLGACVASAGAAVCDDGEPCTLDNCVNDSCVHGKLQDDTPCDLPGKANPKQPPCTVCYCGKGKSVYVLPPKACAIQVCIDPPACTTSEVNCLFDGAVEPGNPCSRCVPSANQTQWTQKFDGPCDDGDACTQGDSCQSTGGCTGSSVACDDGNACTDDACDLAKGCTGTANAAACDDANPCTTGDVCAGGSCKPMGQVACDDGNPCTVDMCDAILGCVHVPTNGKACTADSDPCTQDVCQGGACVAIKLQSVCTIKKACVPAGSASEGNPCLVCDPSKNAGAWTQLDDKPCNDGNACTQFDICAGGLCVGELALCDDKNPCTKNTCTPETGCVFIASQASCDDVNLCTTGDQCVKGKCVGTMVPASACADDNPCTNDACDPSFGCTHAPGNQLCDDGDPCTKGDLCNAAKCLPGQIVCPCEFDGDCYDSNPCTSDVCTAGMGCANSPLPDGVVCSDANACTAGDACKAGFCAGAVKACDDKNPCTQDGCVAEIGCTALQLQGIACSDDSACTLDDLCLNGQCTGTAKVCDDANPCTDDGCAPQSGKCTPSVVANGAPCPDDGVPCSIDQCLGGACDHKAVAAGNCLIGSACFSGGAVNKSEGNGCLGCLPLKSQTAWSKRTDLPCEDGNACTVGDVCFASGACAGTPLACDDFNPCTYNGCNPVGQKDPCLYVPQSGTCDDGNACTQKDTCVVGACAGSPMMCDDGNPCTLDTCDAALGCQSVAVDGGTCPSDGLPCTTDVCKNGVCLHPIAAGTCLVQGVCALAGEAAAAKPCWQCLPAMSQSAWTAATGVACDDGDPCSSGDVCNAGACAGSGPPACDDGNPCTTDTCGSKAGCQHAPAAGACDDGNACTVGDMCAAGACAPGKPKTCPAGGTDCSVALCDPALGCVAAPSCGPLHGCVSGLCLTLGDGAKPGPVTLPFNPTTAPQPLRPSLRWQESNTGPKGTVPQLWLAVQTRACQPSQASYSGLELMLLPPGDDKPVVIALPVTGPEGSPSWCAVHPSLYAHPGTFHHLVAAWLEGGGPQSTCGLLSTGGAARVALVGIGGKGVAAAPVSDCAKGDGSPLAMRPALELLAASGSSADKVQDLTGTLVRAAPKNALAWTGLASAWGGTGVALPAGTLTDATPLALVGRPVRTASNTGAAMLVPMRYTKPGGQTVDALDAIQLDAAGAPAAAAKTVLAGAAIASSGLSWHGVEAAWDPDAARVGVLVAGSTVDGADKKAFLAFARALPGQVSAPKPNVAQVFTAPSGFTGTPYVTAYRIAEIPQSPDFVIVWVAPGGGNVMMARLQPLDDQQFVIKSLAPVGSGFVSHDGGAAGTTADGLSEIALDPVGKRVSLAWEGDGTAWLLTAPVPQ